MRPTILGADPDTRRRAAAGLLAAALTLHDLEEALGYPLTRPVLLRSWPAAPPVEAFWAALAVVTGVGVAAAAWAAYGPSSPVKRGVLRAIAAILLINVLVPHVPAAVILGGYAPGVVTAVAVNLPLCLLALRLLRAEPSRGIPGFVSAGVALGATLAVVAVAIGLDHNPQCAFGCGGAWDYPQLGLLALGWFIPGAIVGAAAWALAVALGRALRRP